LSAEYALLRKVKSGRMSERAYEVATGLAAASEDEACEDERTDEPSVDVSPSQTYEGPRKNNASDRGNISRSKEMGKTFFQAAGGAGAKRQKQGDSKDRAAGKSKDSNQPASADATKLQQKQEARMRKLKRKKSKKKL
jgi:hypothetical protein